MGWKANAFFRGILMALLILLIVFSVSIGKNTVDNAIGEYPPFIITAFVLFILWLGFANVLSTGIERREHHDLDD